MFEGNWRRFFALWLAFLVVLLAVFGLFIWDMSASQTEQRIRGEQATDRHVEYAEDRIDENCLTLEGVALRDCIHQEIEAARDHSRSEQDLDAQQTMAFFTKIMGATALLGVVLGVGSVVLIFLTLSETQRMAVATREIGEAQTRAYVGVDSANLNKGGKVTGGDDEIEVVVVIRNFGNSPAYVTSMKRWEQICAMEADLDLEDFSTLKEGLLVSTNVTMGAQSMLSLTIRFTNDAQVVDDICKTRSHCLFFGEIIFQDVFGKTHVSRYCHRIEGYGGDHVRIVPFDGKKGGAQRE